MSLLQLSELETGYGRLPVLHSVTMRVEVDEIVGLIGPNGAGKTSLAKAVFGLLPPMKGSISFHGEDLTFAPTARRSQLGMSMAPQTDNTFPDLTVEDNLVVSFSALEPEVAREALEAAYTMFPRLAERRRQTARTLSGGERQMLAFAASAGAKPRFLLLDEPTTGLAPTIVQLLIERIVQFKEGGASILWIIEENPLEVLPFVDRVYVLNNGTIGAETVAKELLSEEALRTLFFGLEE
ncbi:MAG TPA: ABC transporter ATP-binding protein [Acidimicrobiia bacterium]|nr:ABC transporter ATP-binding protein [Acidimicrobiia bacterium]